MLARLMKMLKHWNSLIIRTLAQTKLKVAYGKYLYIIDLIDNNYNNTK